MQLAHLFQHRLYMARSLSIIPLLLCMSATASGYNYYLPSSYISRDGNLALGQHAYQSFPRDGGDAQRAVDGGLSGYWGDGTCMHTDRQGSSNSTWWTVKLAEFSDVKVLQIYSRVDIGAEHLLGVEIRAGDIEVEADGDGANNDICEPTLFIAGDIDAAPEAIDERNNYVPTRFRFANCSGQYVTVRLPPHREFLSFCEVMVFAENKDIHYVLEPVVSKDDNGDVICPDPLRGAEPGDISSCAPKKGESQEQALVRAYMEGPINCGGRGFFCRVKPDHAGIPRGVTGTPGDQLLTNRNFGYCTDRAKDRRIDWNNLSRQPDNDDGHCHGSDLDASYIGVLHDHYYRPYRGELECCCGVESRDADDNWIPARNYISRCDYRGDDGNDADQNFERGCGEDIADFVPEAEYPSKAGMCWNVKNFGKPVDNVYEKAPYTRPEVTVPYCQGAAGEDGHYTWSGCLVSINARDFAHTVVMVSPSLVHARYIDAIRRCNHVYGLELAETGLSIFDAKDLDGHGHETDFLRVELPEGQSAFFFQVMDTSSCALSDVVKADIPEVGLSRKMMRKVLLGVR